MKKDMSDNINVIRKLLQERIDSTPLRVATFFKTTPGSYSEHDQFIGVTVPNLRKIAKIFAGSNLTVLKGLLSSKINEERLLALIILTHQYKNADNSLRQELYQFYLDNMEFVNNWNLVDSSAHLILGAHIEDKDRTILEQLARSDNLWERRIAIVSTWYFIRKDDLEWTFRLALLLLNDKHDLIHKAVGWMLREAGKRRPQELVKFLDQHAAAMPRTMLRYAIERFSKDQRASFL